VGKRDGRHGLTAKTGAVWPKPPRIATGKFVDRSGNPERSAAPPIADGPPTSLPLLGPPLLGLPCLASRAWPRLPGLPLQRSPSVRATPFPNAVAVSPSHRQTPGLSTGQHRVAARGLVQV